MKTWAMALGMGLAFAAGTAGATVDLNSATAAQMESELGLTRGEAIQVVQHREQQPFQSPDELSQVAGVSPQKAAQLKGKLSANPPAVSKAAKASKPKKTSSTKKSARSSTSKGRKKKAKVPSAKAPRATGVNVERQGFAPTRSSPVRVSLSAPARH
jgi:hypothetical protein